MAKTFRYQHLRSLNSGTKPSADIIREGEIAVNLADEKMFLKNVSGVVVDFISESQVNAKIAAASGTSETKIETISGDVNTVSGAVDSMSGAVDTKISNLSGAVDTKVANDIKDFFDGAEYDSSNKRINFKHGATVKAFIDATDFIKDGMVDNVEVKTLSGASYLVITFNTDSGKENINIPISSIFDASNYYTKSEADTLLDGKVNNSDFDSKVATAIANNQDVQDALDDAVKDAIEDNAQVSGAIETIVNDKLTNYYDKDDIDDTVDALSGAIDTKQDELVSGTNIKTVLNKSLVGSGNVDISITELNGVTVDGDFILLDAGYYE